MIAYLLQSVLLLALAWLIVSLWREPGRVAWRAEVSADEARTVAERILRDTSFWWRE